MGRARTDLPPAPSPGWARPAVDRRGPEIGPTRRGKGSKIMAICDRHGLPVAVHVASASPHEPHLLPATLDARFLPDLPTRLIGDRGYDSDPLDAIMMADYGIEM